MILELTAGKEDFLDESRDVLRAGLTHAPWLTVDDTGARHKAQNGFFTHIGNDHSHGSGRPVRGAGTISSICCAPAIPTM